MEQEQARQALAAIGSAQRAVRRQSSTNNGVIPLVWGGVVLLSLPLFNLIAPPVAGAIVAAAAATAGGWTGWYAQRHSAIRPTRADTRRYVVLVAGWGIYYALVLFGGIALLTGRMPYPMLLLAPLAALPLLVGGVVMLRQARR